ncbi:hypothetical protein EPN87_03580 [archaeon]|nr:MAG: hypothetical protein EPN87_03580 [archaeon]
MAKWGWKIPTFWVLGAITLLLGTMTAGAIQNYQGYDAAVRAMISLLLYLIGGIFWISVTIAMKKKL